MHWQVLERDVARVDKTSTNTVGDGLNKFALCGSLGVIDAEDVLLLGRRLEDLLDHAGQVFHVDRGHKVLALANNGELHGVLLPCTLKVMVEDGFTKSVEDTSRDYVSFDVLFFEIENFIFNFLNFGVLAASLSLLVVKLCKGVVQEALAFALNGSRLLNNVFLIFLSRGRVLRTLYFAIVA